MSESSARHDHHVLIVNYRSASYLDDLLAGLFEDLDVLCHVWDNASGRADEEILARLDARWPRLRVYRSRRNLGFGPGINRLAEAVSPSPHDCLWLLNPDTRASASTLTALTTVLHAGGADLLSPRIVTGSGDTWFAGGQIDVRRGLTWEGPDSYATDDPLRPATFVTAAALLMKAETLTRLGGFREDLFLYWEDAALSLAARAAGLRLAVLNSAVIWHQVGGSGGTAGKSKQYYFYFCRNRLWVCGGSRGRWKVAFTTGLWQSIRIFKRAAGEKHQKSAKLAACAWGTACGLICSPRERYAGQARARWSPVRRRSEKTSQKTW